jgi:small-conductance mechanosensitive channel
VRAYAIAVGAFFGILVAVWLFQRLVLLRLRRLADRTTVRFDDVMVASITATKPILVVVLALAAASQSLDRPPEVARVTAVVAVVAMLLQIGIWLSVAIGQGFAVFRAKKQAEGDDSGLATASFVVNGVRIASWGVVALVALDNLGIDVTTLVAGLGIGGIAVALALQNILADLFASVSILLDKPFEPGDFIVVGDQRGTVEKIGVKTTRVRSLDGEQLVFANGDLLSSRVRNFKRMDERRVSFAVGVTYETPVDKLALISAMLRAAVESQDKIRFDRAHFKSFGESSLDYEVVYFVLDRDFNLYMDIQEQINLAIVRAFERERVVIAYPTRTLYMQSAA